MSKFKLTERYPLGFLGKEWKEKGAYLDFDSFTANDVFTRLTKLARMGGKDDLGEVDKGGEEMLKLLEEKFIGGKALGTDGELIDVKKEDLRELPMKVIMGAAGFLSQGLTPESQTQ